MSVIPLHTIKDQPSEVESDSMIEYKKVLNEQRAKEIAKDLTKGYMKLLSNFT